MFEIVEMLNRIAPRMMWIVGVAYSCVFTFATSARWTLFRFTVLASALVFLIFLISWVAITIAVRGRPERPELWKSMAKSKVTWSASKAMDRAYTLFSAMLGVAAYSFLGAAWPLLFVVLVLKLVPGFFLLS